MPTLTICPPAPERPELQWPQKLGRGVQPVSPAHREDGEMVSRTHLDFSDYSRMQSGHHHSVPRPPALWAMSDRTLTEVVVVYLERRCGHRKPQPGTIRERIRRVQGELKKQKSWLLAALLRNLAEQKAECNPDRRAVLAAEVQNLDTQLLLADRAFQVAAGCAIRAWRLGEDSVAIGRALGITPAHVRQLISRLRRAADGFGFERIGHNYPRADRTAG